MKRSLNGRHTPNQQPVLFEAPPITSEFSGLVGRYGTILIDPPWRFQNRTGKMAPEHKRLRRYPTMSFDEIAALPLRDHALAKSHLYMWCPNALLLEALTIMKAWGFTYKTNIVWYKVRKDGGPDGRGVGFYFRNVTEMLLFGTRGKLRTLKPGRRRSTSSSAASRSIPGNRTKPTESLRRAVRGRTWSCSLASGAPVGNGGVIRPRRTKKAGRSFRCTTVTRSSRSRPAPCRPEATGSSRCRRREPSASACPNAS